MGATYYSQILKRWDWDELMRQTVAQAFEHPAKADKSLCDPDGCSEMGHVGSAYLGSVMNNTPSGKYYMPWTTNQTAADEKRDDRWFRALDRIAEKYEGWITRGEGDPTDMYFERYWLNEELTCDDCGQLGAHDFTIEH